MALVSAGDGAPLDKVTRGLLALAIGLFLVAVFFICLNPLSVTDFWWQAKTGELIVRQGIPHRDPFSWTAEGNPWLVHEWLTEVFFYLALEHLPDWVLLFYKCGLGALACALVLVRAWKRSGSLPISLAVTLVAAYVLRNYADLRPQMLTFLLLAGMLLALDEYHAGRMRRLPWVLPVVFALWANLHGGVVVGLILITLWVAGEAVGERFFGEARTGTGRLALGVLACCAAVALNPNGVHVYTYPFQVLGHPEVQDYITEWFSPDFHQPEARPFAVMLLLTLAAFAVGRRPRDAEEPSGRPGLGEVLVLLAMAYAALTTQRNTVPYALAASPAIAAGLASCWRAAEWGRLTAWLTGPVPRVTGASAACIGLVFIVIGHVPRVSPDRWYEYGIALNRFPQDAVQWMKDDVWPGRLYNDYVWGGYLIWELYPRRKVFIDGRAEVYYPNKVFDDEMLIHRTAPGWEEALDRRGVDVILTESRGGLAYALRRNPRWELAFTGKIETVFTRRKNGPGASRP